MSLVTTVLFLAGCFIVNLEDTLDPDGDGAPWPEDCASDDPARSPHLEETPYNGVDDDCDTGTPDDDLDGDGFFESEDCDDQDSTRFPGAVDTWYDGVDQNCDGASDFDADQDGWASDAHPNGSGVAGEDCDDSKPDVFPGAEEICGDGVSNDCEADVVVARRSCALRGELDLADADGVLLGRSGAHHTGARVAGAGDLNGDGFGDILLVAAASYAWGGAVHVVLGPTTGTVSMDDVLSLRGIAEGDHAGSGLTRLGDVDDDGQADFLIGANQAGNGEVYLILGLPPESGSLTAADATFATSTADSLLGSSVSGGDDLTGDGMPDLLLGAPETFRSSPGTVYLVSATERGPQQVEGVAWSLAGESAGDMAGSAVAVAGDLDGDGLSDVVVGAPKSDRVEENAGAAYVLLGPILRDIALADADGVVVGTSPQRALGWSVAGGADVDGDGRSDFLMGAPTHQGYGQGRVHFFSHLPVGEVQDGAADATFTGLHTDDGVGSSADLGGDIDGDGLAELLVGANYASTVEAQGGAVFLVYGGPLEGTSSVDAADAVLYGAHEGDQFGQSVSIAPDVNGDGLDELLAGAVYEDTAGNGSGAVYLFLGRGL